MKKSLSIFITLMILSVMGFNQNSVIQSAQTNPFVNNLNQEECKTDILMQQQLQNDPAFAQQIANYKTIAKQLEHDKMGTVYTIPCVVHVIHLGEPVGSGTNISDAQIHSAIDNLNDAYRNLSPYTGVDMEIEFKLVCVDPSGNPTSGITRTDGSGVSDYATNGITNDVGSSMNEVAVKALSNWGNTDYYQFWIVAGIDGNMGGGGVQGYAYFSQSSSKDGAVILYNSFGYDPTGTLCYNLKSYTNRNVTTIHEFGHALGLYHTFEGDGTGSTCPTNNNCSTDGDEVCDTPPHMRSNSDCDIGGTNTCTGGLKDLYIHNFMDYSSDDCQTEFTSGQKTKARAWLLASRSSLTTSVKLTPVAVPVSDFVTECDAGSGCEGSSINFYDISEGNATSWSWSFPGGTPSSSTAQYPTVTYNTAGTYSVSLTATNAFGAGNTETKTGFITIYSSPTAACTPPTGTNEGGFDHVISNVTFNTINNSTSSSSNTTLTDFSCSHTTQVTEGQSYNLSIDYSAGNYGYAEVMEAYIDWNDDGVFDAGEMVLSGSTPNNSTNNSNTNVLIPGTAVQNKLLRMRVYGEGGTLSTNEKSCSATMFIPDVEDYGIYVLPAGGSPPVADFSGTPTTLCEGATVSYTDLSTNTPTSWSWSFPGGTPSSSTSQNPTVTYNTAGTYNVTLTATNTNGSDPEVKTGYITVNGAPGNAGAITGSTSECENATGVAYSIAAVSGATTYTWSAPAGSTINGQGSNSVTIDFGTTSGNVVVTPSNSCGNGGSSNLAVTINVCGSVPVADFSGTPTTLCEGNTVSFTDLSTNTPTSWSWSFPGGTPSSSTSQNPTITYNTAGTYNVTLTATNAFGSDPEVKTGYITVNSCGTTKLRTQDCGITMTSYLNYITCDWVPNATEYEYEFVNTGLGYNQTYVRGNPNYRFVYVNNVPGIQDGITYDVRVHAKVGGSYGSYGTVCQVTTPASPVTTHLRSQDCGIAMTSYLNYIMCDYVQGATEYEYEFVNTGLGYNQTIVRTNPTYRFVYVSDVPGIQNNTTYDVRVRAKLNGVYTAYGSVCQVTTPASSITTQLRASDCGIVMSSYSNYITCDYVQGATAYEYEFVNTGLGYNQTYLRSNPSYRFVYVDSLPGIQLNTTYDVRVRAKVNSVFTAYGNICQVTTPVSAKMGNPYVEEQPEISDARENNLVMVIYPNPNQGEFVYVEVQGLTENTEILVTDIFGKTIAERQINADYGNYNGTIRFDKKLSSGFYMVTVISGGQKTTKKLIIR